MNLACLFSLIASILFIARTNKKGSTPSHSHQHLLYILTGFHPSTPGVFDRHIPLLLKLEGGVLWCMYWINDLVCEHCKVQYRSELFALRLSKGFGPAHFTRVPFPLECFVTFGATETKLLRSKRTIVTTCKTRSTRYLTLQSFLTNIIPCPG